MFAYKKTQHRRSQSAIRALPEDEGQVSLPSSAQDKATKEEPLPLEEESDQYPANVLSKRRFSLNMRNESEPGASESVSIAGPFMRRRSVAEGIRYFIDSERASREKHREQARISRQRQDKINQILIHIDAVEIAMLRAKQSKAQFNSTINVAKRTQSTFKRFGSISVSSGASTAAGAGGAVAGSMVGSLVFPGFGTAIGGVLGGYLAGKATSTMIEYVLEKSGTVTSVNVKTSKLFKTFKEAEEKLDSYAGYVAKKFKDMDPHNRHGQQKLAKEVSKLTLGKIPVVGPVAKTLPEWVELAHETRRAHEGFDRAKWDALIEGTQALIDALKKSLAEITKRHNEENGGEDILLKHTLSLFPGTRLDFDIRLSELTAGTAKAIAKLESNLAYYEQNKPILNP